MSYALRVACPSVAETPSVEELEPLVQRQQHVVLAFRVNGDAEWAAFDARAILDVLASRLPEDVVIFDAGGSADARCITLKRVVARGTILRHAETLHAAALEFKALANHLVSELASGTIARSWDYVFHGLECGFRHRTTGQVVEVRLAFDGERGVLDPQFFHAFLSTTPRFRFATSIFEDPYHDVHRALEVLADHGLLRVVSSTFSGARGFVA